MFTEADTGRQEIKTQLSHKSGRSPLTVVVPLTPAICLYKKLELK